MPTILLTSGRAPVTLDLARKFSRREWRVIVAESIPSHLCQYSKAVAKSYLVPAPRFEPEAFISALEGIIEDEKVDLLLPTCEEIFTIAQGYPSLSQKTKVFVEPLERLLALHSKFHFIGLATSFGLAVPKTSRIENLSQVEPYLGKAIVLKPEYSRFATSTIIKPKTANDLQAFIASPQASWVMQEFIEGRQICTYSIAHDGILSAHSAYATEYTAGQGSTIVFQALEHPKAEAWVRKFVVEYGFTGQIAFDFIETANSEVFAIECNPRAISAIHLFDEQLVDALLHPFNETLYPLKQAPIAVRLALLLYGWRNADSLVAWLNCLMTSQDVIYDRQDWKPFFAQFTTFAYMLLLSFRERLNLIEATTFDIEWNNALVLKDKAS